MDELYGARPGSAASVLYGTKTSSVHGGSATGRREVSAGGKKTDRVAAYQAHAKQWKKDTFLKTGAGSKKPLQPRKQVIVQSLRRPIAFSVPSWAATHPRAAHLSLP